MKILICLLSALILVSWAQVDTSQPPFIQLTQGEIDNNALVNELLQYGLDYNFQKASQKYGISTAGITITAINSVYEQQLTGKTNYQFDVDAKSADGTTMNAQYTVQYRPRTGEKIVSLWNYHINFKSHSNPDNTDNNENTDNDASYVLISEQEILNNTLSLNLLKYGVTYNFQKAHEKYGVPDTNLEVTRIHSVEKQDLGYKVNYRFNEVHADNNDGTTMVTNFTIQYNYDTEETIVALWSYHIQYPSQSNPNVLVQPTEAEADLNFGENEIDVEGELNLSENLEEYNLPLDVEVNLEVEIDVDEDQQPDGSFQQVPVDEIQNSQVINDLLNFGLDYVFGKAAQKYGVSDQNLQVTAVNSVYKQVESNTITNYQFNITATNNSDATLKATFTIQYNSRTGGKIVSVWNYSINYKPKTD